MSASRKRPGPPEIEERIVATRNCDQCGSEFHARSWDIENKGRRFCSRACVIDSRRINKVPRMSLFCAQCGVTFERSESQVERAKERHKSNLAFCSRRCKDIAQRIGGLEEIKPDHYGTEYPTSRYRVYALRHNPAKCATCGWDAHPEVLRIHHSDRDRTNNALSNLEVLCPTCHEVDHFLAGDGRYVYRKSENGE